MQPIALMNAVLIAALAASSVAAAEDFSDRALLIESFSMDEQAPLADAQTALAAAQAELTTAQAALAAANAAVPPDPAAIAAAEAEVAAKQPAVDAKQGAVQAIEAELAATSSLVGQLSDKQVHALNAALQNARKTGLLPLDLDADSLQAILDGGWGMPEISALVRAYEAEARFDRLSLRFVERYENTGNEHFAAQAERFSAKGDAQSARFLDHLAAQEARREAQEAAEPGPHGLANGKAH